MDDVTCKIVKQLVEHEIVMRPDSAAGIQSGLSVIISVCYRRVSVQSKYWKRLFTSNNLRLVHISNHIICYNILETRDEVLNTVLQFTLGNRHVSGDNEVKSNQRQQLTTH